MFIHCKKTGEEYEITDREIGERVECPCCGEKFVVDDTILPADVYTAALIRKTEAIAMWKEVDEIEFDGYKHGTESEYEKLFDRAYDEDNADAQFELAKRLFENHKEYALAAFWFGCAAEKKHPEATYRLAECYWNGIGLRKDLNFAVKEYRNAAKYGCIAAKPFADKFDFAEYEAFEGKTDSGSGRFFWIGNEGGGRATFAAVQKKIGTDKKFEEYLCAKYNVRAVVLFWADESLPEWGTVKGTSFIIGSFASEKEVPREMLKEIEHLTGRDLSYSGRYVDDGIAGETKFLLCYAVRAADEDEPDDAVETHHVSDLLQQELEDDGDGYERRITTWRETIDINCPLCEEKILLPTRLMGSKIRCTHCKGEFCARDEGVMTTVERKAYREEKKFENEAKKIEDFLEWGESGVAALQLAFGMGGFGVYSESIGRGWERPWPGTYIVMWFKDGIDIVPHVKHIRNVLESVVGYWLRFNRHKNISWFVRRDRWCEQDERVLREVEARKKIVEGKKNNEMRSGAEDPIVASRATEADRLEYLVRGGCEWRNRFDFLGYLCKKYKIRNLFVDNYPPGDYFCERHGLKDGFGIIVESQYVLSEEDISCFVHDLEKRFSRKMMFVMKDEEDSIKEYSFAFSEPYQKVRDTARLAPSRSTASPAQAQTAPSKTQPLSGRKVSRSQATLSRTKMKKAEVERKVGEVLGKYRVPAMVGSINPYCYNVCVPFDMADRTTVMRAFNDMFHAFGVLPQGKTLAIGGAADYCEIYTEGDAYFAPFNDPVAMTFAPGDAKYQYVMKEMRQHL